MSEHDDLNKLLAESAKRIAECAPKASFDPFNRGNTCTSKGQIYYSETPEGEEKEPEATYVQWTTSDGRIFQPAAKTAERLTPGLYEIKANPSMGLYFEKVPVKSEGLLKFDDTNSDKVINEIDTFWNRSEVFEEYGLTHKRGILLYGPPGSGKSCTIRLIMKDVVSRGGVALVFKEPGLFQMGMRALRQIQPETPVVVLMEDIDSLLHDYSETEVLNILDGVSDIKKVVFLATTNYPEVLGARIVNRPSRFDKRFRIGYPNDKSRKMYFEYLIGRGDSDILAAKINELDIDLDQWVQDTEKMSVAHLKELFVAVVILGDSYKEAIETLQSMREHLDDKDYDTNMGFKIHSN